MYIYIYICNYKERYGGIKKHMHTDSEFGHDEDTDGMDISW